MPRGNLVALDYDARTADYNHVGYNEADTVLIAQLMGIRRAKPAEGSAAVPSEMYAIPHRRMTTHVVSLPLVWETPLRTGNLRDPNGPQSTFASESFIDELAARRRKLIRWNSVEHCSRQVYGASEGLSVPGRNCTRTFKLHHYRELRAAIHAYDEQIETLARQHTDFVIFDSLPGAGSALVPRLIAAPGTQRDRFHSGSELQCYSGIAPATSGKQSWLHWRWACPKFVRQTFHEWAAHSIGYSAWARTYYHQQRAKGKSRNTAVRALAFKWIRILFRCWKGRTPYQEDLYQQALARRANRTKHGVHLVLAAVPVCGVRAMGMVGHGSIQRIWLPQMVYRQRVGGFEGGVATGDTLICQGAFVILSDSAAASGCETLYQARLCWYASYQKATSEFVWSLR